MRYNLGLSVLTGAILGVLLGSLYYLLPAKFLLCGPITSPELMLPDGVQAFIWQQTLRYGTIPGLAIGLFVGLNNDATFPRGHFSMSVGGLCWIVCTITAYATQGHFLSETSIGRIFITVGVTLIMFFANFAMSRMFSFVEAIRE